MASKADKAAKSTLDFTIDPVIETIDAHVELLKETPDGSPNALTDAVGGS